MTEQTQILDQLTEQEKEQFGKNQEATKTAAMVGIRNSQMLENLIAKVDTIGVTSVRQAKKQAESYEIIKANQAQLNDVVEVTKTTTELAKQNDVALDNIDKIVSNNSEKITQVHEKISEFKTILEAKTAEIIEELNANNEVKVHNIEEFRTRVTDIQRNIERLDYQQQLDDLNGNVSVLSENVSIYGTTSQDNYDRLSKQVELLELAAKNTVASAKAYQDGLVVLTEQVSNMTNRIDSIEKQVSNIRLKPSLISHDAIIDMFNTWDDEPEKVEVVEPEVVEVPNDVEATEEPVVETVTETVTETPKEVKEEKPKRKGFFGLF